MTQKDTKKIISSTSKNKKNPHKSTDTKTAIVVIGVIIAIILFLCILLTLCGAIMTIFEEDSTTTQKTTTIEQTEGTTKNSTEETTSEETSSTVETTTEKLTMKIDVESYSITKFSSGYDYMFTIINNDNKSFEGRVDIDICQSDGCLTGDSFTATRPQTPGERIPVHISEINTGPYYDWGSQGIYTYEYEVYVNGEVVASGKGDITTDFDDFSMF